MSLFKTIYTYFLIVLISISFSACSDDSDSNNAQRLSETVPSIRSFVSHIDVNATGSTMNTVLGNIEVVTEGGSNIEGYTLEGVGRSNFTISKNGELAIGSHASAIKYDLQVTARNSNGDSQSQSVIIEVTTLDQPVLQDIVVNTDNSIISGLLNSSLILERDGNGSVTFTNIKDIEILGDNSEQIIIESSSGALSLSGVNGQAMSVGRHCFHVRAVNSNGIIGPYSSLIINVDEFDYSVYINTDPSYDDYPDIIDDAYEVITFETGITSSVSINGITNYDYDQDFFGMYIADDANYTISLSTDGMYSYSNTGDYIALHEGNKTHISTFPLNYPQTYLTSGYYYINVYYTSDNYTLTVIKQ